MFSSFVEAFASVSATLVTVDFLLALSRTPARSLSISLIRRALVAASPMMALCSLSWRVFSEMRLSFTLRSESCAAYESAGLPSGLRRGCSLHATAVAARARAKMRRFIRVSTWCLYDRSRRLGLEARRVGYVTIEAWVVIPILLCRQRWW